MNITEIQPKPSELTELLFSYIRCPHCDASFKVSNKFYHLDILKLKDIICPACNNSFDSNIFIDNNFKKYFKYPEEKPKCGIPLEVISSDGDSYLVYYDGNEFKTIVEHYHIIVDIIKWKYIDDIITSSLLKYM